MRQTFGPEVFCSLHIIHHLQRLGLLLRKRLFIIVFAGPSDPIEQDAARVCVFEEVDDDEDETDQHGGAERREQADKDAIEGVWRAAGRHLDVFCSCDDNRIKV